MARKKRETNQLEPETAKETSATSLEESGQDATMTPVVRGQTYFGFRVGSFGFLVSVNTFCEVLDKYQINPLPNVQPWFQGLINLRGNLVPIFDLRTAFNEGVGDKKKLRLFIIGREDKAVGIWIDSYPEILEINEKASTIDLTNLPQVLRQCVSSARLHNGHLWLLPDLDILFTTLGRYQNVMEETAS
jgi:chemotaxis signal transduction protein